MQQELCINCYKEIHKEDKELWEYWFCDICGELDRLVI